jgi:Zn-dependent protease with chaperone function
MDQVQRNPAFAASLALTYVELLDGISPRHQRVSLRLQGEGRHIELELRNTATNVTDHWRLANMRRIADQASQDVLIFARSDNDNARIIVREPEAVRAILRAAPNMTTIRGPHGLVPRVLGMGVLAFSCVMAILFVIMPMMAGRMAQMIPTELEASLGQLTYQSIYGADARQCENPDGIAALAQLEDLMTQGLVHLYTLDIRVVDDPMPNAFALAGGTIVFHRGILDLAESPDEIAAVLAHEVSHVVNRDVTRGTLLAVGTSGIVGLLIGDAAGGTSATILTTQLLQSSKTREAEAIADAFAHDRMVAAGLPTSALADLFERMSAGAAIDPGLLQYLSSHPRIADRIERANQVAAANPATARQSLDPVQWAALQNICG